MSTTNTVRGIDAAAVDREPAPGLLVRVAILCAAVAFLDGIDLSCINIAAPGIADFLHLSRAQLGPVFSSGLLGAMLGALGVGALADRYGRRRMLLIATSTFGLFTILTTFVTSFDMLLLLRLLTGLGLGGATPCFIALSSEYSPKARQARITSLVWTAFPLGTVLGTFLCGYLVKTHGWPSIFLAGGIAPLAVTVALAIWLPESVHFLRARDGRLAAGLPPAAGRRLPIADLFARDRIAQTLLLWFAFAAVFGSTVTVFSWTPVILRDHGIPISRGAIALGIGGLGSLAGSAWAGFLLERFRPTVLLTVTSLIGAVAVGCVGYASVSLPIIVLDLMLTGFFVIGVGGAGLLALAAGLYPTLIRSTGVGGAMGFGRFGQVVMPLIPSVMIHGGFSSARIFLAVGGVMLLGALAISRLRMPGAPPGAAAAA